jgi:hypothetical protein
LRDPPDGELFPAPPANSILIRDRRSGPAFLYSVTLTALSKPFGTVVEWRDGIGMVRRR